MVFPHSDYSVAAVRARANAIHQQRQQQQQQQRPGHAGGGYAANTNNINRLGRRRRQPQHTQLQQHNNSIIRDNRANVTSSAGLELIALDDNNDAGSLGTWDEPSQMMQHRPLLHDSDTEDAILLQQQRHNDVDDILGDDSEQSGPHRPGLFRAFMDSAIPRDLRDNTVNIMRGEYNVEKKTLLHHAATSDQYDLFSARRAFTANREMRSTITSQRKKTKDDDDNAS